MEQNEQNMNQTMSATAGNKPSRAAVVLLILVAVIVVILFATTKLPDRSGNEVVTQADQSQTLCYSSSTPTASGFNDAYSLKLTVLGNSATGELVTSPAEKDKMSGTLEGTIAPISEESYVFTGKYVNTAEGMTNTDDRMILLSATDAKIGYGETVQNTDGTYSYKDSNMLDYSLSIPRVDCGQYQSA